MTTTGEMGSGPFEGRGRLSEIVNELRRQVDARSDWVADVRDLMVAPGATGEVRLLPRGSSALDLLPRAGVPVLDQAVDQIAARTGGATEEAKVRRKGVSDEEEAKRTGIPSGWFRRAWADNPHRLADYVNGVWHDTPQRRLVRVLDDKVRAFLGQTYRPLDNLAIAESAVKLAAEHNAYPIEASVSDSHLRLRFVSRAIVERLDEVRGGDNEGRRWYAGGLGRQTDLSRVHATSWGELPGDTVYPALGFSNSETGHGGCDLDGGILVGICFNLAWVRQMVHEVHVGGRLGVGDLWSDDTRRKEIELVHAQLADAARGYFTAEAFAKIVAGFRAAGAEEIKAPPRIVAELAVAHSNALRASDLDALIGNLMAEPGRRSAFAVGQALSRTAQDVVDVNRAADIELLAGQVLTGKAPKLLGAIRQRERELAVV